MDTLEVPMKRFPKVALFVLWSVVSCAPSDMVTRNKLVPNLYPTDWRRVTIITCHLEYPSADLAYCDCVMEAIQRQWTWKQYQDRVQDGTLERDLPTIIRHCKQ